MSDVVYRVVGALPLGDQPEHPDELAVCWLGTVMSSLIGVLTDPPGEVLTAGDWLPEYDQIHRIASIQKAMIVDGLAQITGLPALEVLRVDDELRGVDFAATEVLINGESVPARAISYRGLDFVLGDDVRRHPFTIFRIAGSVAPWPVLSIAGVVAPRQGSGSGSGQPPRASGEPATPGSPVDPGQQNRAAAQPTAAQPSGSSPSSAAPNGTPPTSTSPDGTSDPADSSSGAAPSAGSPSGTSFSTASATSVDSPPASAGSSAVDASGQPLPSALATSLDSSDANGLVGEPAGAGSALDSAWAVTDTVDSSGSWTA